MSLAQLLNVVCLSNLSSGVALGDTTGDEHGYFAFGGSTVLVLFEPVSSIFFDELFLCLAAHAVESTRRLVCNLLN